MLNPYTIIQLSEMNGILPVGGIDVIRTEIRPVENPQGFIQNFEFSEPYRTIESSDRYDYNIKIQSKKYKRWSFQVPTKENTSISNVQLANKIYVVLPDNYTFYCKYIEGSYQRVENTGYSFETFDLYELNFDTYSVNNYLRSDKLAIEYASSLTSLFRLTITSNKYIDSTFNSYGNTLTFYSKLYPVYMVGESDEKAYKLNGLKQIANRYTPSIFEATFILSENDALLFDRYVPQCFYKSGGNSYGCVLYYPGTTTYYTALEPAIVTPLERAEMTDCYIRKVRLIWNNITFNPFY